LSGAEKVAEFGKRSIVFVNHRESAIFTVEFVKQRPKEVWRTIEKSLLSSLSLRSAVTR